jgi:5-formyltetrahydrofolate cyclo-ligase
MTGDDMWNDRDPNIMDWAEVIRWRKAERERLIAARLATSADDRAAWAAEIAKGLDRVIGDVTGLIVSVYWPFRGEPDLRAWMKQVTARGGRCALPVVVEKGQPLIFRCWAEGEPLERGVWNIPIPVAGPTVVPDVTIAPVVGFDPQCYRLGYGGGFFDRTLASLPRKPRVFGIGYEFQAISTIHVLPHDIAMDAIVTENRIQHP